MTNKTVSNKVNFTGDAFKEVRKQDQLFELITNGDSTVKLDAAIMHHPKKNLRSITDPEHILNMRDLNGNTLLYVACQNGHLHLVQYLIGEGSNPHLLNQSNETILDVAARWNHLKVVLYLLENVKWTKRELQNCLRQKGIPQRIK